MSDLLFFPIGLFVGALGTLIGAGGGFILVPLLILLYPNYSAQEITAISMLCVACNASSGSIAYLYRRQVHVKMASAFTLASIPGAWLGSALTRHINRDDYELAFALLLFVLGLFIILRKSVRPSPGAKEQAWNPKPSHYALGFGISLGVGFLASILGIGGGIIHVPLLAQVLLMPVHLAAGTSHLILAISALVATAEHLTHGDLPLQASFVPYLAFGIVLGAQLGAFFSKRVSSVIIMKSLGFAIILVGIRICWAHSPLTHAPHAPHSFGFTPLIPGPSSNPLPRPSSNG